VSSVQGAACADPPSEAAWQHYRDMLHLDDTAHLEKVMSGWKSGYEAGWHERGPLAAEAERERILRAVRRVHRESTLSAHCVNCRFLWPCPTEQALASLDTP
jgi:hypothetical protein